MNVTYDFSGRVALVTGATGAIGSAVYRALRSVGCMHVAHPTSDTLWVTPDGDAETYIKNLQSLHDRVDIMIMCHAARLAVTPAQLIGTDLIGTMELCEAVLPFMREQKFGRVVLFSSIRARWPRIGQAAYAAAKAGVEGLTRALAVEYGQYGITVSCVAPGAVESPRMRSNIEAGIVSEAELISRTPAGRLVTPEDVADLVLWICSDESSMLNGQIITLDGGWSVSG